MEKEAEKGKHRVKWPPVEASQTKAIHNGTRQRMHWDRRSGTEPVVRFSQQASFDSLLYSLTYYVYIVEVATQRRESLANE